MRKEGLPVEGLCVAAGIPSTEKAKEIIDGLRDAGIKHVSFKPGESFFSPFVERHEVVARADADILS